MRRAAAALLVIILGLGLVWLAQGRHLVTMTERLVREEAVDEFGDRVEKARWEPALAIGLVDLVAPVAGGLSAIAVGLLLFARRRDRRRARTARAAEHAT